MQKYTSTREVSFEAEVGSTVKWDFFPVEYCMNKKKTTPNIKCICLSEIDLASALGEAIFIKFC